MCRIHPSCAWGETGSAGHRGNASTYLPGAAHLEGQTPCISHSCTRVMAQSWPGLLPPPAQAGILMPAPPNLPHPGVQPVPGLEEQPVWGLQGLKEGAHLW